MTQRRSRRCSWTCSWRRVGVPRRRSSWTWMPRTIRCTGSRASRNVAEGRVSPRSRFFDGYYDCYCYLPLYIFCGRHLLAAKLRRSNIDGSACAVEKVARVVAQLGRCWPRVRILLRGDSGFAREALMAWCEANRVDFLFGLARNERLEEAIKTELMTAAVESIRTGKPARCFKDFTWSTRDSWSRSRRVVGKAEVTGGDANPRFVVTSLNAAKIG